MHQATQIREMRLIFCIYLHNILLLPSVEPPSHNSRRLMSTDGMLRACCVAARFRFYLI